MDLRPGMKVFIRKITLCHTISSDYLKNDYVVWDKCNLNDILKSNVVFGSELVNYYYNLALIFNKLKEFNDALF